MHLLCLQTIFFAMVSLFFIFPIINQTEISKINPIIKKIYQFKSHSYSGGTRASTWGVIIIARHITIIFNLTWSTVTYIQIIHTMIATTEVTK